MKHEYDVIVAGGGLAGVTAACAASREGANVLLTEKYGYLGGSAVSALVNPFMRYHTETKPVNNGGLFEEVLHRLASMGGLPTSSMFNDNILMIALDQMLADYGVRSLFHAQVYDVKKTVTRIDALHALGMSGERLTFSAGAFVDATGDAELSHFSGIDSAVGREEDGLCQPMTTCFRIGGVDFDALEEAAKAHGYRWGGLYRNALYQQAQKEGGIANPREDVLSFRYVMPGVEHMNSTRVVGRSSLNSESYSEGEIEGRRQVFELFSFLKNEVPGYQNAVLLHVATQLGVRESRRILGEYTLTQQDLLSCAHFEDSIARGCYEVDIHNPAGGGTVHMNLPKDSYYTIPMRCLWSRKAENVVVAGRPISSDHVAHSAIRVLPICASIGEGAGILARLAANASCNKVDARDVRALLSKHNGLY